MCRLSRTIASPHEGANVVLVAEGCPGRCSILVKLSAHLCGFTVFQPSPTPSTTAVSARLEQFKSDLVMAYTRAGAKVGSVLWLCAVGVSVKPCVLLVSRFQSFIELFAPGG